MQPTRAGLYWAMNGQQNYVLVYVYIWRFQPEVLAASELGHNTDSVRQLSEYSNWVPVSLAPLRL